MVDGKNEDTQLIKHEKIAAVLKLVVFLREGYSCAAYGLSILIHNVRDFFGSYEHIAV